VHIDEYRQRKKAGKPIESGWELVHALNEVRERLKLTVTSKPCAWRSAPCSKGKR
jgi:hypothetical protein